MDQYVDGFLVRHEHFVHVLMVQSFDVVSAETSNILVDKFELGV